MRLNANRVGTGVASGPQSQSQLASPHADRPLTLDQRAVRDLQLGQPAGSDQGLADAIVHVDPHGKLTGAFALPAATLALGIAHAAAARFGAEIVHGYCLAGDSLGSVTLARISCMSDFHSCARLAAANSSELVSWPPIGQL